MAQAPPERVGSGKRLQRCPAAGSTVLASLSQAAARLSVPLRNIAAPSKRSRRSNWAMLAAAVILLLAGQCRTGAAADPQVQGVWMIEDEVAIAVADCGVESLCGRVVWLRTPRDDAGHPKRDEMNPDTALRDRPLCGLTVLDGLLPVPDEPGRWDAGSFYDPRNGRDYGLTVTAVSADVLMARVYIGMPFLGVNQTLFRIHQSDGEGWC